MTGLAILLLAKPTILLLAKTTHPRKPRQLIRIPPFQDPEFQTIQVLTRGKALARCTSAAWLALYYCQHAVQHPADSVQLPARCYCTGNGTYPVIRLHLRYDQVRTLLYYPPILIALLMILPG